MSLGRQLEYLILGELKRGFDPFSANLQRLLLKSAMEKAPCVCLAMDLARPKQACSFLREWLLNQDVPDEYIMVHNYGISGIAFTVLLHADKPVKISPTPGYRVGPRWTLEKLDVYA